MANNCYTVYKVEGDQTELTALFNKMQELEKATTLREPKNIEATWLGNLIIAFGGNYKDLRCRGEFFEPEMKDGVLSFATESAWSLPDDIIKFLQSKFPSLEFYYAAEEPGCCYYVTKDIEGKYFPEKYIVEQNSAETTYHISAEELLKDISERIGQTVSTLWKMEKMIEKWNKMHKTEQINVWEVEVI